MPANHPLSGVYTAAVTPLTVDYKPDLNAIPELLAFYARRGCHGALLLGTTGEGPSFSAEERKEIFHAGIEVRKKYPDFRLFAGTGTPSLDATIRLNQTAFELGYDAVVTLPPFYFRSADETGILTWFKLVIENSVPEDKYLLAYHFPKMTGIDLSMNLLSNLNASYSHRFGGLKDSTGQMKSAEQLSTGLPDQAILVGNDRLMSAGMAASASGCITALANLVSPWLRRIYDDFQANKDTIEAQSTVDAARTILDRYVPFPASVKALLSALYDFPMWPVRPPLQHFNADAISQAVVELRGILGDD